MTDTLITIAIVGAAVTYLLEALSFLLGGFFERTTLNIVLSLPLAVSGIFAIEQSWKYEMFVTVPAATFVSLLLLKYLNKPQQVEVRRLPRI
jgi:hypothetical protein